MRFSASREKKTMEILQVRESWTGRRVRVRGARWRVVSVRPYDGCQLLTLAGSAEYAGVTQRILTPFDLVEPADPRPRSRRVGARLWRRACRALLAVNAPPGSLRAARDARLELLPWQLEPALAVVRGLGTRLLLADAVGLGKTIQAGLIASELLARGIVERLLVLTPAGLREQWCSELSSRFAIDAQLVDGRVLRQLTATLPVGVNPWTTVAVAVASVDYVKRAEVLPAVAARAWDLVIVDEAHGVAGDSDRQEAVQQLTSAAAYVLLLTATPHSGDRRAFVALTGLGAIDEPDDDRLLVFRRTRTDVGIDARRRTHVVRVRPTADERRVHAWLERYAAAVRADHGGLAPDSWLALSVLHKRAFSSAWALAMSANRRRETLSSSVDGERAGEQLALPLADAYGELTCADDTPAWPAAIGLASVERERRMLDELASCARYVERHESKLRALIRLLRRAGEPAIIFTEYRDTLLHVQRQLQSPAVILHGGLSREERTAALAAFARRTPPLLLATDAAAEGLNLQHTCRLVINLELPWNPMRLEQRVGRVDRIGQQRRVHAFHLVAAGTGEERIWTRLKERIAAARCDIGAPDPLGDEDERAHARLAITGDEQDDAEDDLAAR
jgi:superfamily II DNA or RNA helicase